MLETTGKYLFLLILFTTIPSTAVAMSATTVTGTAGSQLKVERLRVFDEPWAMTFLPDTSLLVTEKPGRLWLLPAKGGKKIPVSGLPRVAYGGQGGLGDIILHPGYTENGLIYFSYAEQEGSGKRGAAVAMARLERNGTTARLHDVSVIWRQVPKVSGRGHYSHRLAIGADGKLYITSGERQKQQPAQSFQVNLGKIIRLNLDGSVPGNNPFQDKGELARTFWTLGHRNMLGLAVDNQGRLWAHEMGPRHGDELNIILPGKNYGWPLVSWGNHYSGLPIPDHDTRPEFQQPATYWVPTIAPSGLIFYSGTLFSEWQGDAFIGGLASKALIRVRITGDTASEVERFGMGKRIREVEEGPDGAIWLLEDQSGAGLLRLTPAR